MGSVDVWRRVTSVAVTDVTLLTGTVRTARTIGAVVVIRGRTK
jgi:hypothetical protein